MRLSTRHMWDYSHSADKSGSVSCQLCGGMRMAFFGSFFLMSPSWLIIITYGFEEIDNVVMKYTLPAFIIECCVCPGDEFDNLLL